MSAVGALTSFTLYDAASALISSGVGLAFLVNIAPRVIAWSGATGLSAQLVMLLTLSAGIWLGNILSRVILGR